MPFPTNPSLFRRVAISVIVGVLSFSAPAALAAKLERAAAMAPLKIPDFGWDHFRDQLNQAKSSGIDAVSTDVWWGLVEKQGDQQFDWSYYDHLSDEIIAAGLEWVPILSFHQCGGNVGDDVNIPLPEWLWTHFSVGPEDLQYRSEQGNLSPEVLSLWADDIVRDEYREFMQAFETHFAGKAGSIGEINISCGPAGELRYPSYNSHDHDTGYPNRGALQCYGILAESDFREDVLEQHGTLAQLNQVWGTSLQSIAEIRPPSDAPGFFDRGDYVGTAYGRDLLSWYNRSLVEHGAFMLTLAQQTFDEALSATPLAIKIPGVHWRMADPQHPRVAEMCAGLIPTDIDYQSDSTAHGYAPIIDTVATARQGTRPVLLHFTCLEMGNENQPPAYSQAENLVFWIAAGAADRGLTIMGENALSGGVLTDYGWGRIDNAFQHASYRGLTVLRIGEVTDNAFGNQKYQDFILKFK